jgi:hypothetical protein
MLILLICDNSPQCLSEHHHVDRDQSNMYMYMYMYIESSCSFLFKLNNYHLQMTKPASTDVVYTGTKLLPLQYEGVKLMSMGFINKGASIVRPSSCHMIESYSDLL